MWDIIPSLKSHPPKPPFPHILNTNRVTPQSAVLSPALPQLHSSWLDFSLSRSKLKLPTARFFQQTGPETSRNNFRNFLLCILFWKWGMWSYVLYWLPAEDFEIMWPINLTVSQSLAHPIYPCTLIWSRASHSKQFETISHNPSLLALEGCRLRL